MKKNFTSSRRVDFITLKTNTMKTDAKLHPFALHSKFSNQKNMIFRYFLTLFYVCIYIFTINSCFTPHFIILHTNMNKNTYFGGHSKRRHLQLTL